jgi:hypothetical protein
MDKFDMYIVLIFFIKIVFMILAVAHLYLRFKGKAGSETDKLILYWKERIEFVFIILMSFLLIYIFNPTNNRLFMITRETKILLFLFGFILIITANWSAFVEESDIFKDLQSSV